MKGIQASTPRMPWEDGSRFYRQRSLYGGRPLVHVKVLSDRRTVGGQNGPPGWTSRTSRCPPERRYMSKPALRRGMPPSYQAMC